jgi:signal transduction histidine kinase
VEFSTLVRFSKLVSDSPTSEGILSLLGQTVLEKCGAFHVLVLGTGDNGDFTMLSSCGASDIDPASLELDRVFSIAELREAVAEVFDDRGYASRIFPLIADGALFGALVVLYMQSSGLSASQWTLVEGLTELTAISLNKAHQYEKLRKALDDLRISQDALVRTEKFRALGQMSAGVAHDLKNLLNPLLLYSDEIRDSAAEKDDVLELAGRMERILTRGLQTVDRLRDFSRQSSEETEAIPTNLNAIAHEALDISRPRMGSRIVLTIESGNPPETMLRPSDCLTAIVNLLFNAADALQGEGAIVVRTGASDGGAWIEVQDNGPGIPSDIKNRILEPFFTTKGEAGTGLGLSIVHAFTERHGGRLEVESVPGEGAKFKLWFPAIAQPAAPANPATAH